LTALWDSQKIISDTYKPNRVTSFRLMDAFRYFNDARFNLYKDDFAM